MQQASVQTSHPHHVQHVNPQLMRAMKFIAQNIGEEISLNDIAAGTRMSKFRLCRLFREHLDTTPMRWLWELRTRLAAKHIACTEHCTFTTISTHCGFSSMAHFSRAFRQVMGTTPSSYRSACEENTNNEKAGIAKKSTPSQEEAPNIWEVIIHYLSSK